MKYVLMFAVALTLVGTASAQRSGSGSGGAVNQGGGSAGGGSLSGGGNVSMTHIPPTVFTMVGASGDNSWVPSTILPWADAVALGAKKQEPSLGDVAREYRKEKAEKK